MQYAPTEPRSNTPRLNHEGAKYTKEEGRRKKEEGRRKKEEGRRRNNLLKYI
ncbi:hypothetical protein MEN95_25285 [Dolichospermum sp. ST_sed7]|nr:hypothetical protein [Dolichospermum sp. ST_sed7]